jgi:hypothetical protein
MKGLRAVSSTSMKVAEMHRHLLVLVFSWPLMAAMQTPAIGQSAGFAALEGKSISVDYREQITTPRGQVLRQTWRDRIYISTKGRIFHRFDLQSSMPGNTRTFETFGDESGRGAERRARYVWTGQGISRQRTNRRGVALRQTITIVPTGTGYSCQMTLERSSNATPVSPLGQSCRVLSAMY